MALPATDSFTTGTTQSLTAYSSNWTANTGVLTVDASFDTVQPGTGAAEVAAHWNADTFSSDHYSQGVIAQNNGALAIGVGVRHGAGGVATYYLYYSDSSNAYLYKNVTGTLTQLGSNSTAFATSDVVRLEAAGTTITPKRNGSTTGTPGAQSDSAISTGAAGLTGYGTGGNERLDDWEGGNLVVIVLAATGFPAIAGTVTPTNGTSATTTPVVNLPTGCVAGETVCVLIRVAVAGAIGWPDGTWNELFDVATDASDDQMAFAWRKATGTEGATITLSSASGKFAALAWRVAGARDPSVIAPEISTIATGTSTTPDPSTVTPTGGQKNYLFGWLGGWEGEQTSPPASNPSNYALSVTGADSGTAGLTATNCRVAVAFRQLNAASDDPGSWTISASDDWTAYSIAFHPADLPPIVHIIPDAVNRAACW